MKTYHAYLLRGDTRKNDGLGRTFQSHRKLCNRAIVYLDTKITWNDDDPADVQRRTDLALTYPGIVYIEALVERSIPHLMYELGFKAVEISGDLL